MLGADGRQDGTWSHDQMGETIRGFHKQYASLSEQEIERLWAAWASGYVQCWLDMDRPPMVGDTRRIVRFRREN